MDHPKTWTLNVAGLSRELVLCPISETLDIAAFIMFSDVELTVACAQSLLEAAGSAYDVFLTAESKGIPLAYEMARQSGKPYYLARKSRKLYMRNPVEIEVKSITTSSIQKLFMDENEMGALSGKRVLLVDDVISTGESMAALEQLVHKAKGSIAGKAAVLAEGDAADRTDIVFLAKLPLFFK